jgi:hypothetical protein
MIGLAISLRRQLDSMMKYFLIYPPALIGHSYFTNGNEKYSSWEKEGDLLIIESESELNDLHPLLSNVGFYIFDISLKNQIEKSDLKVGFFKKIDKVLKRNFQSTQLESIEADYYLLLNEQNEFKFTHCNTTESHDIFLCRASLIVSERALNFLIKNNAFKDDIEGSHYGTEYEALTNRFLIEGDVESFILNRLPKHREHIALMRKKIMDEYRRREGLPPLP